MERKDLSLVEQVQRIAAVAGGRSLLSLLLMIILTNVCAHHVFLSLLHLTVDVALLHPNATRRTIRLGATILANKTVLVKMAHQK
jgi:hypothetical protein